jgi:hypothetical protein
MRTVLILLAFLVLGTLFIGKLTRNQIEPSFVPAGAKLKESPPASAQSDISSQPPVPAKPHSPTSVSQNASLDRTEQIRALARQMANDPARAAAYIQQLISEGSSDAYVFVAAFLEEYARMDPAQAVTWSDSLPQELKLIAYDSIGRTWAANDPTGAAEWTKTVVERSLRMAAVKSVSAGLDAAEHQALAARWAKELSKGKDAAFLSDVIARHWAREDIPTSFAWVVGLEDLSARDRGLEALAGILSQRDPRTASQWAEQFPSGLLRDNVIQATVLNWATQNPQAAAEWLTGLKEQAPLEAGAHPIFQSWSRQDPEAAKQWLQSAPLSENLKDYMLKTSPNPGL